MISSALVTTIESNPTEILGRSRYFDGMKRYGFVSMTCLSPSTPRLRIE